MLVSEEYDMPLVGYAVGVVVTVVNSLRTVDSDDEVTPDMEIGIVVVLCDMEIVVTCNGCEVEVEVEVGVEVLSM